MSLDPAQLEAAIRRNDPAAVRDLLKDATESQRAACSKALKAFLAGPKWHRPEMVMLAPQQFMEFLGSGFQDKPAAIQRQEEQQEELNRDYDAWREIANGLAFQLAALGLAGGVAVAARVLSDFPISYNGTPQAEIDFVAAVLADRRPDWLADLVDRHLRQAPNGFAAWPLARTLVRLGAIDRPTVPEYATLMPSGVLREDHEEGHVGVRRQTPAEALLTDPGLFEDEFWRLFTVPDAGAVLEKEDRTFAWWAADGDWETSATWTEGVAQLCEAGHIDRDRLIDACLGAFTRDFHPARVSWYAATLARLAPSPAEIAARTQVYLGLLGATAKQAVAIGQQGAGCMLDAGQLAPDQLLEASGPALIFPQKGVALAQLKLIDRLISKYPDVAAHAAATVAMAFGHERQDIQEAALALIRKHGIPAGAPLAEISLRAADLSPSLAGAAAALGLAAASVVAGNRKSSGDTADTSGGNPELTDRLIRLEARIGARPAAAAAELLGALTLVRSGGIPGPAQVRPSPGALLQPPVTDPAELVQLLTTLIEDATDAIAAERALAGAVRLSALPRDERRKHAGPLLKRAQQVMRIYEPFSGDMISSDMALVTHVWGGEALPVEDMPRERSWHMPGSFAVSSSGRALTMAGIFSARAWEAARLIETGRGGTLLAEPETERGAITGPTLLARVRELAQRGGGGLAGKHDQDVAMLRLAPGDANELWDAWGALAGLPASTLHDFHQMLQTPLTFVPEIGLPRGEPLRQSGRWHVHVLARITTELPALPACRSWQLLTAVLADPLRHHAVLGGPGRYELRHYDAAVAGWSLICPWQPDLAAAHLLRPLSDGLIPGITPAGTALESVRHPGHPMGPVGHLALVTGLSSAEADTRIAAAQLWAEAADDGRLDPELAASAIVTGVTGNALKLSRITGALQHASYTPLAARRIVETACLSITGLAASSPANMHQFIELAARLAATVGAPGLPSAVLDLAGRRGSRLATTASQLIQARESAAPDRGLAGVQALQAMISRAEAQR